MTKGASILNYTNPIIDTAVINITLDSTEVQQEALDQLIMGQDFLLNCAQSEGNPDNKEESIKMVPGNVIKMLYDSKTLGFVNPHHGSRWSGA